MGVTASSFPDVSISAHPNENSLLATFPKLETAARKLWTSESGRSNYSNSDAFSN